MEGILHVYHPSRQLLLFEHTPRPSSPQPPQPSRPQPAPPNTLLFIGGMYDNFLNPSYTTSLSALFPRHPNTPQTWSLMHLQLSSSGRSFGTSTLDRDIEEIATGINYIREHLRSSTPQSPIVLLGHSTGCQDLLHYLSQPNPLSPNKPIRPAVQGAILQAPVSDRDQLLHSIATESHSKFLYDKALSIATNTPEPQLRTTLLPLHLTTSLFGPAPMSVTRFLSLASPSSPSSPGPDDLFSHDATDARLQNTFGNVGRTGLLRPSKGHASVPSVLALVSASDEFVPPHIDKPALLSRWRSSMGNSNATLSSESGLILHGDHGLSGEDFDRRRARMVEFRGRVLRYLDQVVGGVGDGAWRTLKGDEEEIEREEQQERRREKEVERGVGDMKL